MEVHSVKKGDVVTTIEVRAGVDREGQVYYTARTRIDGRFYSEPGDNEQEAIENLRLTIKNSKPVVLPAGYPKVVEVDW